MIMDIQTFLQSDEPMADLEENVYAIRDKEGIVFAFNIEDAFSVISDDIGNISIFKDDFEKTAAQESTVDKIKRISGGRPILVRYAQWGGIGSMPDQAGQGIGAGGPMGGATNFNNPLTRIHFDKSLDTIRNSPEKNGWFQSLETRMEENPLYGHQRNTKDRNLQNYRLTYKERMNEKKKDYIRRMIENKEKFDKIIDGNSVASIKATPLKPSNYVTMEDKLKTKRQQEDPDPKKKRPQHGPESQFTHFPKPPVTASVKTAVTVQHNGLGTVFDDDPEAMADRNAYDPASNSRLRFQKWPWMAQGRYRQEWPLNIGEEQANYWDANTNGTKNNSGEGFHMDLLMNSGGRNPGDFQPDIFDSETMPAIIDEIRNHLNLSNQAVQKPDQDMAKPLEERLQSERRKSPTMGVTPTYQQLMSEYPWATKNFFEPRYRSFHSREF